MELVYFSFRLAGFVFLPFFFWFYCPVFGFYCPVFGFYCPVFGFYQEKTIALDNH